MKYLTLLLLLFSIGTVQAQDINVIDVPELQTLLKEKNEKVQVINFWATWCGPCIKELPYFEKANATMDDKIEVKLVTVDFVEDIEKVKKFVLRKELKSAIYLIDNVDYNSWIDLVDESWSGAIPATLLLNPTTGKRRFVEKELKEGELETMINELL